MKLLVTGATGFLGSHCVAALVGHGHQVRILARTPARVAPALAPHGAPPVEVVQGDVTDRTSVERALAGCQAVLHAAAVFSMDPRRGPEMARINEASTRVMLEAAHVGGCDPVVYVSSIVAVAPVDGIVPADPPLTTNEATPYIRTKLAAERIARAAQEGGAPVVTTYPGSVWGPHDPVPGELVHLLRGFLGNRYPMRFSKAGLTIADVRWVAAAHAGLFVQGLGPRRVNMGGRYVPWAEIFASLRRVTGRRLPTPFPTPKAMALLTGRVADQIQRVVPWRLPFSYENTWFTFQAAPADDSRAVAIAGPPPPLDDTMTAAIRWAAEAGHIPRRWAGRALVSAA